MNRGNYVHLAAALPAVAALTWLRNAGIVMVGSAVVAICAHIALPLNFTPVPLTLQPFAVLLLGLLLPPGLAVATLTAYLLEGIGGLPVFSIGGDYGPGLAHLMGPTGGYLMSYPVAVFVISYLWRSGSRSLRAALLSAAAGNVVILAMGAMWLSILSHSSLNAVLNEAIIPFLPGDLMKIAVAAALAFEWQRLRPAKRPDSPTV